MNKVIKLLGALIFAGALVVAETSLGTSTAFGQVIPIQAHIFILAFILIYLVFSVGEVRDRLDAIITLQEEQVAKQSSPPQA